jgi:hypothetical protein
MAHILILGARVKAKRQAIQRRQHIENRARRFRHDRAWNSVKALQAGVGFGDHPLESAEAELMAYVGRQLLERSPCSHLMLFDGSTVCISVV